MYAFDTTIVNVVLITQSWVAHRPTVTPGQQYHNVDYVFRLTARTFHAARTSILPAQGHSDHWTKERRTTASVQIPLAGSLPATLPESNNVSLGPRVVAP